MSLQKNNEERPTVSWKPAQDNVTTIFIFTVRLLESWNDEKKDEKRQLWRKTLSTIISSKKSMSMLWSIAPTWVFCHNSANLAMYVLSVRY